MEWILWALIGLLFIGSIVGVFIPIIPDALLIWAAFLLYQFGIVDSGQGLSAGFWWGMGALTLLMVLSDLLTNIIFVKKYGGSKWGIVASIAGVIIGPFVLGPFGFLMGPILAVFLVEWVISKDVQLSFKIAFGTLVAFFSSSVVKIMILLAMIIWFFIAI